MRYKNNPFNIRYSNLNRWKGLLGQYNGFCTFVSLDYGVRTAAYLLMISYRKRGLRTYAELINAFAPPQENDTWSYIKFVTDKLHVMPFDVPHSAANFAGLLHYMWIFEQGSRSNPWPTHWILNVINSFKLVPYDS